MSGAFIKGFQPQFYDLLGHNHKKDLLALQRDRLSLTKAAKEKEMRDSGVREATYKKPVNDKFRKGYDALVKEAQVYAKVNANALNRENTATDNINGEYNPEIFAVWQNMVRNIEDFSAHGEKYVAAYTDFQAKHKKSSKYDQDQLVLDDSDVQRDNVYVTKEMMVNRLEENYEGRSYTDLTNDEKERFSSLWYGHDKENTDYYQSAQTGEGGVFEYNDQGQLLNSNGGLVRGFERVGERGNNPGRIKPIEGGFTYERIFNEEYNNDNMKFDPDGNLLYNDVSFVDHWDMDYFADNLLKDKDTEIDAISMFADKLTFDQLLDIQTADDSTEFLTDGAINGLRKQALRFTQTGSNNLFLDEKGVPASRQVAIDILRRQGIEDPSKEEIQRISEAIKKGNTEGGLISEDDGDFKYLYGDKKGQKIEHFSDLMAEQILENYMTGHAQKDSHYNYSQTTSVGTQYTYSNDAATSNLINIPINGDKNHVYSSTVTNQQTLGNKSKISRPSVYYGHDFGDNNQLDDLSEIGMITNSTWSNDALKGVSGKMETGNAGTIAIDKNTGAILAVSSGDNDHFVFNNIEDAKNAIIVPVVIGSWIPKNPGALESDMITNVTKNGVTVDDGSGGQRPINTNDIGSILNDDKSIDVYYPLNSQVLQGSESDQGFPSLINQSNNIQKNGIYYNLNGVKTLYTEEATTNNDIDLTFGGLYSA